MMASTCIHIRHRSARRWRQSSSSSLVRQWYHRHVAAQTSPLPPNSTPPFQVPLPPPSATATGIGIGIGIGSPSLLLLPIGLLFQHPTPPLSTNQWTSAQNPAPKWAASFADMPPQPPSHIMNPDHIFSWHRNWIRHYASSTASMVVLPPIDHPCLNYKGMEYELLRPRIMVIVYCSPPG